MSNPERWKSWEGRVIEGKFPLRQWLGGSDHSAVFLTEFAEQPAQRVAIKLIPIEGGHGATQLARLQATRRLSHPHLIRTLDCGLCRIDGIPFAYVLMECADDDLSRILPERPLVTAEVSQLLPPVIDALAYLHRNGFVHGRVKPSNVLASGDQLKLSSDQVAPAVQQDGNHRRRDVYDAPETAAGIISPAGDVWSVGVTLVAALTQNVTIAEAASPENRHLPETIPQPFRGIVRECLQLDPSRRGSLRGIQEQMQPAASSVPVAHSVPTAHSVPVVRSAPAVRSVSAPVEQSPVVDSESRRPLFIAGTLIVVVLGIILAVIHYRAGNTPETAEAPKQAATETASTPAAPVSTPAPPVPGPVAAVPKPSETPAKPRASGGEVVRKMLPDVPRSAQNTIRGTIRVIVQVEVDPSGKVTSTTLKMRGSSRYFANQALKAAQQWEFSAPQVDGQPAASTWLLQFRFKRKSIQATPERVKG
jgi:TonB family protein